MAFVFLTLEKRLERQQLCEDAAGGPRVHGAARKQNQKSITFVTT